MNEIWQIVDAYNEKESNYNVKRRKLEDSIARAQKRLDKLYRNCPTRNHDLITPIAKAIMEKCGFPYYEIYGPFGCTNETTIYFSYVRGKNGGIDICDVETWSLTFQWRYEYDICIPMVWTGETTNEYAPGTIGHLNGMNHVFIDIPSEMDELIKLLRHSVPRKEGE